MYLGRKGELLNLWLIEVGIVGRAGWHAVSAESLTHLSLLGWLNLKSVLKSNCITGSLGCRDIFSFRRSECPDKQWSVLTVQCSPILGIRLRKKEAGKVSNRKYTHLPLNRISPSSAFPWVRQNKVSHKKPDTDYSKKSRAPLGGSQELIWLWGDLIQCTLQR